MKRRSVPDSCSSNTEASSAELCPGSRAEPVTTMGRTEVCSTGGVDHSGVFAVGWTSATIISLFMMMMMMTMTMMITGLLSVLRKSGEPIGTKRC